MALEQYTEVMLPAIESELQRQIARLDAPQTRPFYEMLSYHMGWTGEGRGPEATGKRIRPLLVLLVTAAFQSLWLHASPAAAAVELVHNFSLVHDDIQDNSDKRRGRPTVWKKWNMPQAINVGDALFVISNQAVIDLSANYPADRTVEVMRILQDACLDLTRGQYLDIAHEHRNDLSIEDYWQMIQGKTASLLAGCTQVGAVLGGADQATVEQYGLFGRGLGLAFQVQDDILGIWGNEALTGKSTASDLVEGKNSLPILFGISQKGKFAQRWAAAPVRPEEVAEVAGMLAEEGAREYAQREAERLTAQALETLAELNPGNEAGRALVDLTNKLLNRRS
ncbi:MAG TPA: polyprenyl synthetase family protein [Anaerolineales bacterium]|nr:polyprenyl synthetase family protein [Anaerolineales bacterium]